MLRATSASRLTLTAMTLTLTLTLAACGSTNTNSVLDSSSTPQAITLPTLSGAYASTEGIPQATISEKQEVIYASLDYSGASEALYVVNHFKLAQGGFFSDYGAYESIENLSTTDPITQEGNSLALRADKGDFYYQGNTGPSVLPWNISISYTLDDQEVAASQVAALAGKSGRLGVSVHTSKTPNVDPSFFENYVLQVSILLKSSAISNLNAPDATITAVGSDTQLNFMFLPNSSGEARFEADFSRIELPGLQIAAAPFSLSFATPDTGSMTNELNQLTTAVGELQGGIQQLDEATVQLDAALAQFAGGSEQIGQGLNGLSGKSSQLSNTQTTLNTSLTQSVQGLQALQKTGAFSSLSQEVQSQLATLIGSLDAIQGGYQSLSPGLKAYLDGVDALAAQYASFSGGLGQAASGMHELSSATGLLNSGIGELYSGVRGIPATMQTKIDEFVKDYDFSGFEPHSFMSAQNQQVSLVQFVISTPAIELPKATDTPQQDAQEPNFIERLLALFGS
ncbi:MAG: hypothetical protein LBC35_07325 [Coriobacteriales bacterium]|nr:hypothetical protein [Coriobacteriales bacterium]